MHTAVRSFALVGPGRAGTALALALVGRGWRPTAVTGGAGRSAAIAGDRLGCAVVSVAEVGSGADLVLVTTPDAVLTAVVADLAPGLEPGALVVHCSGAQGLGVFDRLVAARPDVAVGALHPLQTFATADPTSLAGVWAAVAGPAAVTEVALDLGLRPFVVPDDRRAGYHAAAAVASNHLVALLGQVARLADAAGVPADAFWPLVHTTVDNAERHGPGPALTGPVARGDVDTVAAHLAAVPDGERDAYRALARAALALSGRDDPALGDLLGAPGEVVA